MDMKSRFEVEADAATSWAVIGAQFGDIAAWATAIQHSVLHGPLAKGARRTCVVAGFGPIEASTIVEELVVFEPEARRLVYTVREGLPPMMLEATNRWAVEARGERASTITSHATVKLAWWALPLGPMLRWRLRRDLGVFAEELRHRVERGVPHPRKTVATAA